MNKFYKLLSAVALVGVMLTGCHKNEDKQANVRDENTFTILATSDLKDVQPIKDMVKSQTGIDINFKFTRTMDGVENIMSGNVEQDAAWFANAKYLLSTPEGQKKVLLQEKIMSSPIVIGVSESKFNQLGWKGKEITWKDIAQKAESGDLRYTMSNPSTSNQGFSALIGVATAFSGKSEALTKNDINEKWLQSFFKGYTLVGDNSAWIMDRFVEEQGKTVDAYINYESILMSFNNSGRLKEKLVLVYPKEGISTADYPFMLLNDKKREQYTKIVNALKSKEIQSWLTKNTLRRSNNDDVAKESESLFPKNVLIELPFTTNREVADILLNSYLDKQKLPSAAIFVIDVSGSMSGSRERQLKQSLAMLAGQENSFTGNLAKFRMREKVWIIPFNNEVVDVKRFDMPNDTHGVTNTVEAISDYVNRLNMNGGTALYTAAQKALQIAESEKMKNPKFNYTVVLFTDGEVNHGINSNEFIQYYQSINAKTHVFPIVFGEGNKAELESVAKATGGKSFDANQSLNAVFKEIRGYQ